MPVRLEAAVVSRGRTGRLVPAGRVRFGTKLVLSALVLPAAGAPTRGAALRRKYGDRVGYHYYDAQDAGIFWSNDPALPIARMLAGLGFAERVGEVERDRGLQDRARGGPPAAP